MPAIITSADTVAKKVFEQAEVITDITGFPSLEL